ncbi:DUF6023 family protein [Actinoplanes sp. TRM 88003]|uniref:DUF6023 family protein n=1 Tax=Paractinoplanes aksuensis TaxID=2939490 RepID=A0ABT1DUB4_9ACTN|nr:DUF6023 family protein [Actinoplanes aksuensis]MCO8274441.1 DUF6023 family protein [Actinoplanes aksuensis]
MTGERARGAVLYAAAAVLVVGGASWFFASAPPGRDNDQINEWRTAVEQQLPDTEDQVDASTSVLGGGADQSFETSVETGEYRVSMICRGGPESQLRVSLSQIGPDTGRGLQCSGDRPVYSFEVGLGDVMRLNIVVSDNGPVVFRYQVEHVFD